MEGFMPTLQVRDLPEDIYVQLNYLAEKEHRSLAQETIVLLKEGIATKLGNKERRRKLLEKIGDLNIDGSKFPDPVDLIREDRER
jgi:plasmid stability protein